nr:hypothetical protein [Tanacetum cinerariifolium]
MVERDDEIKVLGEVNMELESGIKKLSEKLSQEEDTEEEAFEDISGKSCDHSGWDWPENGSPEVAEEVIEMANDQAEALPSDKEVTDECLDDEQFEERRPRKSVKVTQEDTPKDEKLKKGL